MTQKEVDRYAARAPAPRRRVGRARGPLALRPDQRRAQRHGRDAPPDPAPHPTADTSRGTTTQHHHRQHVKEKGRNPMGSVRVAIVGVGNCATSLIQGVSTTGTPTRAARCPGLMHVTFGDYHVSDVEFVAAFDVDAKKVGFDLSEATQRLGEQHDQDLRRARRSASTVQRGHTLDGLGKYYRETIEESDAEPVDVVAGPQGHAGRRARLLPAGGLRGGRQVLRPVRDRRRGGLRQRAARSSSPPTPCGPRSSRTPASRSSATTSSPRSARPSPTG